MPASRGALYRRSLVRADCSAQAQGHSCLGVGTASARLHAAETTPLTYHLPRPRQTGVTDGRYPIQAHPPGKGGKKKRKDGRVCISRVRSPAGAGRFGNDPAAGSPTATLLRLLLPLAAKYWANLAHCTGDRAAHLLRPLFYSQSVATTGGVYKWQGHNQGSLMNCLY